jgi:hypothetical protein
LGFGEAPSPRRNREKLAIAFGPQRAGEMERAVEAILDELGKITVDWHQHSLESAGDMVYQEMHRRHPGLSDAALRAMRWKFTFDRR